MDNRSFDQIARVIGNGTSRRKALRIAVGLMTGVVASQPVLTNAAAGSYSPVPLKPPKGLNLYSGKRKGARPAAMPIAQMSSCAIPRQLVASQVVRLSAATATASQMNNHVWTTEDACQDLAQVVEMDVARKEIVAWMVNRCALTTVPLNVSATEYAALREHIVTAL